MLFLLYIVCILMVAGLAMLFHASFSAPRGVEDDKGFHFTEPVAPQAPSLTEEMLTASDLSFFTH